MTYVQPPTAPPVATNTASGLAIAALAVGIAAFVLGLVPFLGLLLGLVGVVLGIIALGKPGRKVLPGIGLALSGVAALSNIAAIVVLFIVINLAPSSIDNFEEGFEEGFESGLDDSLSSQLDLSSSTTPCFSFETPREFIPNQSSAADEACYATREGWGEMGADGTITYTGVGAIWDQVLVEPIRVDSTDTWVPDGELDSMVDYLESNYFPQLGEVITLRESVTLDGEEANLTRLNSDAESTVTKATLVVKSPEPYSTANGDVQFFLITFVIDDERGDEIIDALVDSWRWH